MAASLFRFVKKKLSKGGSRKTLKRVGKLLTLKNYAMKKNKLLAVTGVLLLLTSQTVLSQANRTLSNLRSPTAVNQHLLPNVSCTRNLGSNNFRWKNLYLCNKEGINVNPVYPLDIRNSTFDKTVNIINPTTGETIDRIGLYSSSIITDNYGYGIQSFGGFYGVFAYGFLGSSGGLTRGVFGQAEGNACLGSVIGVHGFADGAANNYGVFGEASDPSSCGSFLAAGYFAGDVYANNYFFTSDRKFKTNIDPLKNSLEQLMKLKPSTFEFKTADYPTIGLSKGMQTGLIADEVKQVFPEFVKTAVNPARYDRDRKLLAKEVKYDAVNYMALIPVVIAAIQEQQKTIDAVKAENLELKSRLDKIEQALALSSGQSSTAITLTDARLEQNAPNPFNQRTVINYFVPQQSSTAVLRITDMNGRIMKTVTLSGKGKGQLVLDANLLSPGVYQYSLLLNGKLIDTRQMIITK